MIEALQCYRKYHVQRLEETGLSEDMLSDLENDRHYLEAILQDFEKHQKELLQQRESVQVQA